MEFIQTTGSPTETPCQLPAVASPRLRQNDRYFEFPFHPQRLARLWRTNPCFVLPTGSDLSYYDTGDPEPMPKQDTNTPSSLQQQPAANPRRPSSTHTQTHKHTHPTTPNTLLILFYFPPIILDTDWVGLGTNTSPPSILFPILKAPSPHFSSPTTDRQTHQCIDT